MWHLISVIRLPAAAMLASAGVAVRFEIYLCLWKTVANTRVSRVLDDGFLEMIFIPGRLVLVGELLILGDGGQGNNVQVREGQLLHTVAVERGIVGDVAHLGLLEDEG